VTEQGRRPPDLPLLVAILLLLVVGIVMVYSASVIVAHNEFNDGNYFLTRHLLSLSVGLVLLAVLGGVDYHYWRRWALVGVLVAIGLLILVLVPGIGVEQYGARRWLPTVGPLPNLQPSEFAKLAVVVFMASWMSGGSRPAGKLTTGSLPFLFLVGIVTALILREPDMGSAVALILAAGTVFWIAGANLVHMATVGVLGGITLAWLATSAAYRADRLQSWMDPWRDPEGIGWHTVQNLIAIGSGGLIGVNGGLSLGAGRAKAWVPNAYTDAVLAVVGEELGLLGTLVVVALFAVLAWRGLLIAARAPDGFGQLLAAGMTGLITWQALLNMMVVTNVVPFTGITLPFLSFGGSSLVMSLAATGLLLNVSRARAAPVAATPPIRARPPEPARGQAQRRQAAGGLLWRASTAPRAPVAQRRRPTR
jgi:cell division protein FtsW